jgi:hypothetical protein
VDNGEFDPHGFGVGAAASLAVGLGVAMVAAGNNVAAVMEEAAEVDYGRRVDEGFRNLIAINESLAAGLAQKDAAYESLLKQFKLVAKLALAQQEQLTHLRGGS